MGCSLLRCLEHLLPPPSSLTFVSAELFLSHCLTTFSSLLFHCSFFLPFLNSVIPEALPPLLFDLPSATSGSVLQPANTGLIRHGGSFSQLLTEATPIAPLLPNLATQIHNNWLARKYGRIIPWQ